MTISNDTIFALSTAPGRGAIAVVRISGDAAAHAVEHLTGRPPGMARQVELRTLRDGVDERPIDRGLLLWFPTPNSYTGEDVAELHVHGGRAVVKALLDTLALIEGLRPAEPGEFTRRAFEAGRLDLTAAEGIADLIAADTEAQRRLALRQSEGRLGALCEAWRERLVRAMAYVEADIDFSDQDLPDRLADGVQPELREIANEIGAQLDDDRRGERLREGIYVAILGPPNVGKSSLLNRLAGRDAAIVSEGAGTTRDVIEVQMDLKGWPILLADTAGLRETSDEIEREGVRRARERAEHADLAIVMFDGAQWPNVDRPTEEFVNGSTVVVLNKTDLVSLTAPPVIAGQEALPISCTTGAGLEALMDTLVSQAEMRWDPGEGAVVTRARHRQALDDCRSALQRVVAGGPEELVAEDLRIAAQALGRISGRVDVEEVLDVVFRDFCIGK